MAEYRVQPYSDSTYVAQYDPSSIPETHPLYSRTKSFVNISGIRQTVELEANKEIVAFNDGLDSFIRGAYKTYTSSSLPPTE